MNLGRFTLLNKIYQAKHILEVFTGKNIKVFYFAIFSHKSPAGNMLEVYV